MNTKMVAAMAIALLMASVGVTVAFNAVNADSYDGKGVFNFNIAVNYCDPEDIEDWDGPVWTTYTGVSGYNAYLALSGKLSSEQESYVADDDYTIIQNGYTTINPDYGEFTSIFGYPEQNGYSWYVYIYSPISESWVLGPVSALGFYQAYSDYDSSLRTANIILYYSDSSTIVSSLTMPSGSGIRAITDVYTNNAFKFTFHIAVDSLMSKPENVSSSAWTWLQNHQGSYVGYGSNAFLALRNAISGVSGNAEMFDIPGATINNSSYGYVDGIFSVYEQSSYVETTEMREGVEVDIAISTYDYWSFYTGYGSTQAYSLFTPGFLTAIDGLGVGFEFDEYTLIYSESVFQWDL